MRIIFILTVFLSFIARLAYADPYAWCAVYSVSGSTSCNFMTLEQCQTTIAEAKSILTGRQAPIGHRQPTARDLPADVLQSEERATPSNGVPKICKGC